MKSTPKIGAWGDSITNGVWDEEQGGWVRRIHDYYEGRSEPVKVLNFGINGERVNDVLSRFKREYAQAGKPATVLIAVGINDSPHGYRAGTPFEKFKSDYEELVEQAIETEARVVLVGLTNVINGHRGHSGWRNDTIKPYDEIIGDIAASRNLSHVNLWGLITPEYLEIDGIHPDAQGHEIIFQEVLKTLNNPA